MKEYVVAIVAGILLLHTLPLYANETGKMTKPPVMDRCAEARYEIGGNLGHYISAITANWLLVAPDSNPAMLEMFRDRDKIPYRQLNSYSGEYAGKYLTGAVQVYRVNRDPKLRAYIQRFVKELVDCQDVDGYLGQVPRHLRFTFKTHDVESWDTWNHYHIMIGLMLWADESGDRNAFDCAEKIGDILCDKFQGAHPGSRMVDGTKEEVDLAPIHSLCLIYEKTGNERYLQLAKQIALEFQATNDKGDLLAGDYIRVALSGKEFFQSPKPRWEALHAIMGIVELYRITGDEQYRTAFENIWWSIVKLDRHNNGGFSSLERACGNPYDQGPIETCCTIAWTAMSVEMLRLAGDSRTADEIELSTLNSIVGLHSPTGRWSTYNTPMDGVRKASPVAETAFQARPGSPELNCCSVNAARGFGMISDWAVMRGADGSVAINYYGPSTIKVKTNSGNLVSLKQTTDYPANGRIVLEVSPAKAETFALNLRIPYWSANTNVKVNGKAVGNVAPGRYLTLSREWKPKDKVEINLDMSLHYWVGEKECEGKTSIYQGPILLTYDRYYNDIAPDGIPALDAKSMVYDPIKAVHPKRQPVVLLEFTAVDGSKLRLCDFGSAGYAGTPYKSWLKVDNAPKVEYSKSNPLRSGRI